MLSSAVWKKYITLCASACFFASVFVRACVCVIIMSRSEAIWVGWLICICGVNRYKYSWPGSKLVWIFILPPGRRRVEWLWFQSAEQKLTQPFFVVDENTWWLPWASFGMLGELHMYMDYFICFSHMVAVYDVHRSWGSIARKTERQMEANTNSTCLGTKTVWDDAITLQNGQEAAVQRIQQSPIKKLRRQYWEASWWCQPTCDAVQPTQLNVACLSFAKSTLSVSVGAATVAANYCMSNPNKIPWSSWLRATFNISMETFRVAVMFHSSCCGLWFGPWPALLITRLSKGHLGPQYIELCLIFIQCGWRGSVFDVVTLFSHNFISGAFAEG